MFVHKRQKSAGDDESILALKPMGRIIPSPKQKVPVAPLNGPHGPTETLKTITSLHFFEVKYEIKNHL